MGHVVKFEKSSSPEALRKATGLMRKDVEYEIEDMMVLKWVKAPTSTVSDVNPESTQLRHKAPKKKTVAVVLTMLSPSPA